jgi:signal transduction histidine kinase
VSCSQAEDQDREQRALAVVAHELKGPLHVLKGTMTLARMASAEDEGLQRILQRADRQLNVMTRLVDDLYDAINMQIGQLTLRRTECELASLVHEVTARFEEGNPGVHVLTRTPERLVASCDAVRIEQLLWNLLTNALKYGGKEAPIVATLTQVSSESILLFVSDEGPGIPKEMLARVFQAFVRGEVSKSTPGLGIGLWLVSAIAALHGGAAFATSGGRGGTSVFVTLPRTPPAAPTHAPLWSDSAP